MGRVKAVLNWLDRFQQRHPWAGFPFAVVKKFGDDQAGNLAALIAYYGFFSLFPLLHSLNDLLFHLGPEAGKLPDTVSLPSLTQLLERLDAQALIGLDILTD